MEGGKKASCGPMHLSDHGTLGKGVRAGVRVSLFHPPAMCPDTDVFQAHREGLPTGLKLCALSHSFTPALSLAITFFFCKEETTESISPPSSHVFLDVSKIPSLPLKEEHLQSIPHIPLEGPCRFYF